MLLKFKHLVIMGLVSSLAHTSLALPSYGRYELTAGPSELCESFTLTENSKHLRIGERYVFPLRNSISLVQSDIDPECSFSQKIEKRQNEKSIFIIRTNEEICHEKPQSKTTSSLRVEKDQITLWQVLDADVSFSCQWKKQLD